MREAAFDFQWKPRLLLSRVSTGRGELYAFNHHDNDLLRDLTRPDRAKVAFGWTEVADRLAGNAPLPFTLAKVDESEYRYRAGQGRILIEVKARQGKSERMEVVTRYGRILSVKEE